MLRELTPSETITRGLNAARLLTDDVFLGELDRLAETFYAEWLQTKSDDVAKREALWHQVTALYDLKSHLAGVVQAGEYETKKQEGK